MRCQAGEHLGRSARLRLAEAALARLDELAESGAAPDAVIDRLRATLQARIGTTRARLVVLGCRKTGRCDEFHAAWPRRALVMYSRTVWSRVCRACWSSGGAGGRSAWSSGVRIRSRTLV